MGFLSDLAVFGQTIWQMLTDPWTVLLLFGSSFLGIIFGAMPGLTATLGVALLTTLTYSMNLETALVSLIAMYVGAVYGGSYPSILINIPGTAAGAATALDGYPMAQRGEGGRALGLTTTASFIGTLIGMIALVAFAPLISDAALQFTSYEFFLLAFFGIIISGTLTSTDLVYKGWIAGLLGLALACIGRDQLQFFPRFTFGVPELDSGIEVVPVLIGAFALPQIIRSMRDRLKLGKPQPVKRILPEFRSILKNMRHIVRSSLMGVGIGAVPGVGEDIAGWVSYGTAKNTHPHPERFGTGEPAGVISSETANNACIGGALIPLTTLGIPGSPPAVMLLGALMLHGLNPGPMVAITQPDFLIQLTAIMALASLAMWLNGMFLAKHVIKVLRVPAPLFLPIVAVMSVIGSYALGLNVINLYLMVPVGIAAFFLSEMDYPISPLVIGVILGPMADENLRRALMVSEGSLGGFFERPVSVILITAILLTILSQVPAWKRCRDKLVASLQQRLKRRNATHSNGEQLK
jgi:putative tricarboxylic transport membrane protein